MVIIIIIIISNFIETRVFKLHNLYIRRTQHYRAMSSLISSSPFGKKTKKTRRKKYIKYGIHNNIYTVPKEGGLGAIAVDIKSAVRPDKIAPF